MTSETNWLESTKRSFSMISRWSRYFFLRTQFIYFSFATEKISPENFYVLHKFSRDGMKNGTL